MNAKISLPAATMSAGAYVPLNRQFVPIDKDKEIPLDLPPFWGRKYHDWLGWPELLQKSRVVLLAEAGSGKTEDHARR